MILRVGGLPVFVVGVLDDRVKVVDSEVELGHFVVRIQEEWEITDRGGDAVARQQRTQRG